MWGGDDDEDDDGLKRFGSIVFVVAGDAVLRFLEDVVGIVVLVAGVSERSKEEEFEEVERRT